MFTVNSLLDRRLERNNFDLLRFLFAAIVCLVHAGRFSGYKELHVIGQVLESAWAVKGFFVVSGFLIFMSYERSPSIRAYASSRIRRIYPAYVAIVMICALGLVLVSSKSVPEYFSISWLGYVVSNLLFLNFLQPDLPGVFDANTFHEINGSLWTLKIEVMFYLSVPFFVYLFRRYSPLTIMLLTYCLSMIYAGVLMEIFRHTHAKLYFDLARQLPGQLSYFMAGAFFYYYFHWFERWINYFMAGAILVFAIRIFYPLPLLEPIALAAIVIYFGMMFRYVGNFGRYGDFSYGLYIVHYPLLQLLVWTTWFSESPWLLVIALFLGAVMSAVLMWFFVEKHFLKRNNHYRYGARAG